jgi:SAM-dependent methyltransferase
MTKIDFDSELARGVSSFDGILGKWWIAQAADRAHGYAYRKIANYLRASFRRSPRRIIDYACGAGNLISRLALRFPESHLIGLDGSSFLLGLARRRIARLGKRAALQVTLIQTVLPNFTLLQSKADLVVFAFPNMAPSSRDKRLWTGGIRFERKERAVARDLSRMPASENDFESEDPATICFTLLRHRMISLNLRLLLKRSGTCVRVEYGTARRHELTKFDLMRVAFVEGSLDAPVNGKQAKPWFRILASSYFRSRVIEDVHQQTSDPDDMRGGYLITVLRAI